MGLVVCVEVLWMPGLPVVGFDETLDALVRTSQANAIKQAALDAAVAVAPRLVFQLLCMQSRGGALLTD